MAWLHLLLDPLSYPFMMRALMASIMVGVVCSVLGTYVILQGMAFFGDALAHAILPGIVIAVLVGWPLQIGALVFGVLTALGIGVLSQRAEIKEDTAIGIVFAGSFALGVALLSTVRNYAVDLTHILFGNVLGVSDQDLWIIFGLGVLVLLTVFAFYKEFLVLAFDPVLAAVLRLPDQLLRYLLLILLAVTVVVALQTVGVALMLAMLVTPATAAYLLSRRMSVMMVLAAIIGAISNVTGLYISYYVNMASGPVMVLVATGIFLCILIYGQTRSLLRRRIHQEQEPLSSLG
jgi:ABC-type Mn2+/Zn2+ transport system permease subunit